ncbi:cutinase domain-containing protein [Sarocladium implicatum]|nr:cutinase domain-containing protein [Sarocladium implicatum]
MLRISHLLLALTALVSNVVFVVAAPVQRQVTCYSGVYMIIARGSNEDPGEGRPSIVADLVAAAIPGSGRVAVDYPATITGPLYPTSVTEGINDAIEKITSYVDACGDGAKIALLGYSQGGNVMTNVLAGGVAKPDPISPAIAAHISAVTVFGDPTFSVDQTFNVGTSTQDGIFTRADEGDSLALLNTYAAKIQSYCDEGDPFCARGVDGDVHSGTVPKYAQAAANFIVSKST